MYKFLRKVKQYCISCILGRKMQSKRERQKFKP
jgi:hypothetical protein